MDFMFRDDACGRYGLKVPPNILINHYRLLKVPNQLPVSLNISPGSTMPVVIASDDGKPKLEMMQWGLVPSWWKKPPKKGQFFNARDDSVFNNGLWNGIYRKRALIPATGYFEWTKKPNPIQKFWYYPKKTNDGVFSFAGIYDVKKDAEGRDLKTYTIITTEPNKEAAKVHNRMPVILHQEDESSWLESSRTKREDIESFLRPLEDGALDVREVDSKTSSYKYDDEGLTAPLKSK